MENVHAERAVACIRCSRNEDRHIYIQLKWETGSETREIVLALLFNMIAGMQVYRTNTVLRSVSLAFIRSNSPAFTTFNKTHLEFHQLHDTS